MNKKFNITLVTKTGREIHINIITILAIIMGSGLLGILLVDWLSK